MRTIVDDKQLLVQGHGSYLADILPPNTLHAGFVRSYFAYADISDIYFDEALALPGIQAAYSGRDLQRQLAPTRIEGPGLGSYDSYPLAVDQTLFVGEPVAVLLGTNPYVVEDAIQRVRVDYVPRTPVMDIEDALSPTASVLHGEVGSNLLFELKRESGDPEGMFATADVVIDKTFHHARQSAFPLETRGILALVEPLTGQLIIYASTQNPHIVRTAIAEALRRSEESVRVITPHIGGGFGLKVQVLAEDFVVARLAEQTGRPVRWVEDRRENLMGCHARGQRMRVKLAADKSGRVLAADINVDVDVGAHSTYPVSASLYPATTALQILSVYDIPNIRIAARGIATNKCPLGPYRGVGIPAAVFASERVMDELAWALSLDRIEVRLSNLIPPDAMPFTTAIGTSLDSGDYPEALRLAKKEAAYEEFLGQQVRNRSPREDAKPVTGIGIAIFNEYSGPGSRAYRQRGVTTLPGFDSARITMGPEAEVSLFVSSADSGQDHVSSYRLVVARELGIDPSKVKVVEGDTDHCPPGTGNSASRSGPAQLSVAILAARSLKQRLVEVAALILDCSSSDVSSTNQGFQRTGGDREITIRDVAKAAHLRVSSFVPPPDFQPGLEAIRYWDAASPAYPYGAHIAVVELDPATMEVRLMRYTAVEDCGVVVNQPAVDEQILGGIVTGIGNALFEEHHYDDAGQIQTSSLLDYLVPLASEVIPVSVTHLVTATDRTVLGSKGVGEAGTIGAVGAIGSAVADAIRQLGGDLNKLPASPNSLFMALQHQPGTLAAR